MAGTFAINTILIICRPCEGCGEVVGDKGHVSAFAFEFELPVAVAVTIGADQYAALVFPLDGVRLVLEQQLAFPFAAFRFELQLDLAPREIAREGVSGMHRRQQCVGPDQQGQANYQAEEIGKNMFSFHGVIKIKFSSVAWAYLNKSSLGATLSRWLKALATR